MTLYHVSNSKFDRFDASFLNSASESRCVSDEMESVSKFGFCFVREEDLDALFEVYGEDFGDHVAEVEADLNENFTSTYDDFTAWLESYGEEAVRAQLEEDGVDHLELFNGSFWEIVILDVNSIEEINWIK